MSTKKQSPYDENPFAESQEEEEELNFTTPFVNTKDTQPPPWLQESAATDASKPSSNISDSVPSSAADPAVPRFILYTRVINLMLSICMIVVSLLSLLTTQTATTGVLSCYVVVFSCLLCCFETHLKQISKLIALNFGFMYSAKSRSVFMIFLGTILFSFSLFGKVIGILMLANAAFNIYILFRYPEYEVTQRNDALSEIKGYLSAHPAFAQTMVDAGVKAGSELIKNNPEIARKGAEVLVNSSRSGGSSGGELYANV